MTDGMRIEREFAAPIAAVWAEWTTPVAFADWFGGPASDVVDVVMDVQVGGRWSATMFAGPARIEIRWAGRYLEVDPPHRLRATITDQPDEPDHDIMTVTLTALAADRTQMVFEQGGAHLTPAQIRAAGSGWGTFFDRMAERVAHA